MAKITAEEYAKVKQATSKYTDEQKQQIVDAYKSGGVSAAKNAIANQKTPSTPVATPKQETTPTTPTPQETPTTTPTTPTSTPTTPKANETVVSTDTNIKQEGALKPLSQEYYNQTSQEAQDKIVANLNGYRQTNPEYFSSYEDFKKNFSYDSRNEQQKNTLDQWYKGYTKGMELSGLPVTDLYTQWKDGTVSNSDLENLRISNPGKYTELQNTINKGNIIAAYDDDKGGTETGMSIQDMAYQMMVQTFNQYMNGDSSSGASEYFREYEEKMNDPEMKGLSDQCTEVQEQMENIQSDLDAIKKTVEAEYEGTGASRAKINAIISDRSYDLQLQLRTLNSEYNKYATQYNNRMNQYQNEFNLQLQEYQLQQNERQMQMKELGFAMDLMSFETPQQAQEREWNYWVKQQEYANGNINSKDYQTRYKAALKSVENLLSQYEGIPMVRSAEQMAQDVLKAIDNGSDLGTELTKINQQIQQKDEYKQLYNNTFGSKAGGVTDTFTIGGQEYVVYDGKMMTADAFNKQFGVNTPGSANYTVVSEDALKFWSDGRANTYGSFMSNPKNNDGNYIGECGKFVNNYLQEIGAGRLFGNEDIKTRESWINSDAGKVGTIAVFDYNNYSSDGINHGHVAIVVSGPDKDGNIWVKDANFDKKNPGVIMTRKVNLKDASLKGFIDPSLDQNGNRGTVGTVATLTSTDSSGTTNTTLSPEDEAMKKTALAELTYGMLTPTKISEYGEIAAKQGWNDEWISALNQNRGVNMTQDQSNKSISLNDKFASRDVVKDYKDAVTSLEKLIASANADNGVGDMAAVFTFMKTLDPSSVVREGEFQSAAKTAGVLNPAALWQKVERLGNGEILTPQQREDFIKVAKEYVKSYSKAYELEYKDLQNQYKVQGIPEDALPINRISYVEDLIDGLGNGTQPTSMMGYTKGRRMGVWNTNTNNKTGNPMENTNFYQTYANTAPSNNKKYVVNGVEIPR